MLKLQKSSMFLLYQQMNFDGGLLILHFLSHEAVACTFTEADCVNYRVMLQWVWMLFFHSNACHRAQVSEEHQQKCPFCTGC